jgi:hypothetical protein
MESEPSTPTTPGFLSSSSSARNMDIGRPFSLGYQIGNDPLSLSASLTEIEDCPQWRISDFEDLNNQAIYIPLDFYPLCKCSLNNMEYHY